MDSTWDWELYTPSAWAEPLNKRDASLAMEHIAECTRQIRRTPYEPAIWFSRGQSLVNLQYPELALGDFYKARYLVEARLEAATSETAITRLRFIEKEIWKGLMYGIVGINAPKDYFELSFEAAMKFPGDEDFFYHYKKSEKDYKVLEEQWKKGVDEEKQETTEKYFEHGGVFAVPYPWMPKDLFIRDDKFLAQINRDMARVSDSCEVRRSNIRDNYVEDGVELENPGDSLAVFATRDIKKGEVTLLDKTTTSVVDFPGSCPTCCRPMTTNWLKATIKNPCCKQPYCSKICAQTALEKFHPPECKHAEALKQWYRKDDTPNKSNPLSQAMFLKLLTHTIHEGASHPLRSNVFKGLKANYTTESRIQFNWTDHIVTPIQMLSTLEIDVFARPEYDTWVLQTMFIRMNNNEHAISWDHGAERDVQVNGVSISPLYSFHNHSCDPNVTWNFVAGEGWEEGRSVCSELEVVALRDVREGEELCITYIPDLETTGRRGRNEKLFFWIGGDCGCGRCVREMEEEDGEGGENEEGEMEDGEADDGEMEDEDSDLEDIVD